MSRPDAGSRISILLMTIGEALYKGCWGHRCWLS